MTQKTLERTRAQASTLECGAFSDKAGKRINEDAVHTMSVAGGMVALVADGISSGGLGDTMSRAAIAGAASSLQTATTTDPETALVQAFHSAHEQVMAAKQRHDAPKSGTTLVSSWMIAENDVLNAHIANIGDSRAYLLQRDRRLIQITQDHSTAERLTYALGFPMDIASIPGFYRHVRCERGDTLLLCSDGLYRAVPEQAIIGVLTKEPPRRAAKRLVQLAIQNHTRDNASAIVLRLPAPTQHRPVPWLAILGVAGLIGLIALVAMIAGMPLTRPFEQGPRPEQTEAISTPQQLAPGLVPTATPNLVDGTLMPAQPTITRQATNMPTSTPTSTYTPTPLPTNTPLPTRRPPPPSSATSGPAATSDRPAEPATPVETTAPVATATPEGNGPPTPVAATATEIPPSATATEISPSATPRIPLGEIAPSATP